MNDYLRDRVTVAVGKQYLIDDEIGRGGMAVVYRATDLRLHRVVALKVLPPDIAFNPDVRVRFIREAQTAAQLNHPNIVPIYSVDDSDREGLVYFVMAYVDGESLGARLAREGAWPVDRATRVLGDVADALAYAHARGVVHRDIKPDNILIDRASGRPLVTDFGIARAAAVETRLTVTGVAVGTPAYMSPEQAMGERELDGRSDLYSLGVVGYHMLSGETPFKAGNTPAMLVKHVSEQPRPLRKVRPEVPKYLGVAIDRALEKKPEDRWADAAEFRDALDGAKTPKQRRYATPAEQQRVAVMPVSDAPYPAPPPGLTGREFRQWQRHQARLYVRDRVMTNLDAVLSADPNANSDRSRAIAGLQPPGVFIQGRRFPFQRYDDRPLDERVSAFRRSVISWLSATTVLFGVNLMAGGHPWFMFPSAFLFLGVVRRGASIWSDGIGPLDAFKKGVRKRLRAERGDSAQADAPNVPRRPALPPGPAVAEEVLAGTFGDAVRRALDDRITIREISASLTPVERDMIPDTGPTVDALAERVVSVATTLHRLDTDVSGASLGALDSRIAALETEPATDERERRLSLLQRQRGSLRDLIERRRTLANQIESAGLMLQNLKLDLLKLRSSGIGSEIETQASATQEARALSREIGHVVQAADELKKL